MRMAKHTSFKRRPPSLEMVFRGVLTVAENNKLMWDINNVSKILDCSPKSTFTFNYNIYSPFLCVLL